MSLRIKIVFGIGVCLTIATTFFATYWINTQPIASVEKNLGSPVLKSLPKTNVSIIQLIEAHGKTMAPNYKDVVCTEFVIDVIDRIDPVSKQEKNDIRIITNDDLDSLISVEAPVIKGVQTALLKSGKGIEIRNVEDVMPGDFVQFWNLYQDREYGHCGVVLDIEPFRTITLYSSHPFTNGYGKQKYLWPDKLFFVRLK